ncbi:MAG: hypothetical protein JZU65_15625, partial [Chlorobium sp.]|nr:hypothetical protein [Chlorobium sp.]
MAQSGKKSAIGKRAIIKGGTLARGKKAAQGRQGQARFAGLQGPQNDALPKPEIIVAFAVGTGQGA